MSMQISFTKENIKFLDKLHEYIAIEIPDLPPFYILSEEQITFVFEYELSNVLNEILTTTVENYSPPQSYTKINKIDSLNISNSKINSLNYTSCATYLYTNVNALNFGLINIISNMSYSNNSGTYQIKIYDILNNKVIKESELLNNEHFEIIPLNNLENVPTNDTFIEIQIKVSDVKNICNIKAISFVYLETIA